MLQKLRSKSAGLVAKALMVLLIIAFGTWGVQGYLGRTGQGEVVAAVGGESITSTELAVAFARDVRRFQAQGSDLTAEQARAMGLMDLALDRLIQGRTYEAAAKWLGMGISDARIAQAIREEELFYDESGEFSRSRFEFLLRNSGLTEAEYVTDLRRDMTRREIINSLAFTKGAPAALEKRLHLYRNERRIATTLLITVDDSLEVGMPGEDEITQIHQDEAERYTAPERRSATFLLLTTAHAMNDVTVPEEDLRNRYDESLANYTTPEKRTVQQMRFDDEETARKAAAMIGEGRSFAAVAKEVAGMEGDELDYGEFAKGGFPITELAETIDGLAEGGVSEPISTDFGWHIFHVSAITPESVKPFDEVRAEIEEGLKKEQAGEVLYDMSTSLEDELAGGATLESAAATIGVEAKKSGLVDIEGMDSEGKQVEGLPGGEFLNTLFVTGAGELSSLQQLEDGSYYILRTDEVVPSALRPLDEVRDQIIANWQADKRRDAAQTRALGLVDRVESGESLTDIAAAEGLEASDSKPFTRRGEGLESDLLTPVLVGDIFRLQPGQAAMAETGAGFVVAMLKSIQPAGPSDTGNLAELIGNQITGDILRQFDAALRQEFSVSIDEAAKARTPLQQ